MILLREKIVGFRRPLVCAGAGGLCTPGQKPAAGGRVRRPVPGAGRGDTVAVLDGREAALDADVVLVAVCAVGAGWRVFHVITPYEFVTYIITYFITYTNETVNSKICYKHML